MAGSDANTRAIERLTRALEENTKARSSAAASGARAGAARDAGAVARSGFSKNARTVAAGQLLATGVGKAIGLASSAVSTAGAAAGAGLINSARGGTFSGGAASSINSALASTPFIGEAFGFASTQRIQDTARGNLNQLTNPVTRFGGAKAVSPRVRNFLADLETERARNVEQDQKANAVAINDRIGRAAQGQGAAAEVVTILRSILSSLDGKTGNPGGFFA